MDKANRQQKLGLVWRNRNKISQIIKDYFYLLFFFLIILCWDPIDLIFYRERASQPARMKRKRNRRRTESRNQASRCCLFTHPIKAVTHRPRQSLARPIPPPPFPTPTAKFEQFFSILGQKRGWPPFRGLKVL
jgi:hypothetical protein